MKVFVLRCVWRTLTRWQIIATKYGFEEQVMEIERLKHKIMDCKIKLLKKGGK